MTDNVGSQDEGVAARRARRWIRVVRVLQVALAGSIAFATWSIAVARDDGPAPVLPDVDELFSLDLQVIGSADGDVVYAVEQRARPAYRILAFDPESGAVSTVFTVPEDAIVYGIALSDDRETLALAYSPDYAIDGSGISTIAVGDDGPVDASEMVEVVAAMTDRYLVDVVWSDADTVLATEVDRRGETEELSVVSVSMTNGLVDIVASDAVDPAPTAEATYFLDVDDDRARRTIGRVTTDGERASIEYAGGGLDLDQLVAHGDALNVAVVESEDNGLTFGSVAGAHGNHDVPSQWWTVTVDPRSDGSVWVASELDQTIVYDTAATGDGFVYATREGLSLARRGADTEIDVIASRALRFVAA